MIAFLLVVAAIAGDPPARTDKEIRELVSKLASPNPKPITGEEDENVAPDYRLPPGFDEKKQKAVREAIEGLRDLGPKAFPALIDGWDDKRHCVTTFHRLSEYSRNASVGRICRKTIYDQIQPYSVWPKTDDDPRGKPKRPGYPDQFLATREQARRWWESHKDKTLYQIQLEALDWVIAEEAKSPEKYNDEEREFLRAVRAELVKRGKPMAPGNYDWQEVEL